MSANRSISGQNPMGRPMGLHPHTACCEEDKYGIEVDGPEAPAKGPVAAVGREGAVSGDQTQSTRRIWAASVALIEICRFWEARD